MIWIQRIQDESVPLSRYAEDARNWTTCAVGEARRVFPGLIEVTIEKEIPKDERIKALGMGFWRAVKTENRDRALRLYFRIHARLLRMMRNAVA